MPGYVKKARQRFNHIPIKKNEDQPYQHAIPNYGAKAQYAEKEDSSELLDQEGKTYVQQVVGTFLFYARAVDSTMLTPLSAIAMDQASPTQNTLTKVRKFLDYAATHPDVILTY